jgi:hypothetical protein
LKKQLYGGSRLSGRACLKNDQPCGLGFASIAQESMDVHGSFIEEPAGPVDLRRIWFDLVLDLTLQ